MIVAVDLRSPVPPFEQLRAQITELVHSGGLVPGQRLPTVRQLAADLGLAPGTVARAYRELEATGVVTSNGRHGTRVRDDAPAPAPRERELRAAALRFLRAARDLGASEAEIDAALRAVRS